MNNNKNDNSKRTILPLLLSLSLSCCCCSLLCFLICYWIILISFNVLWTQLIFIKFFLFFLLSWNHHFSLVKNKWEIVKKKKKRTKCSRKKLSFSFSTICFCCWLNVFIRFVHLLEIRIFNPMYTIFFD